MSRPPVQLIKPRCVTKHVPLPALRPRSGLREATVTFVSPAAAEVPAWRGEMPDFKPHHIAPQRLLVLPSACIPCSIGIG